MKVGLVAPIDYYMKALRGGEISINNFYDIQQQEPYWQTPDADLHIYPYTHAVPSMLSMGCKNKCSFCPTAMHFKGTRIEGDPGVIIPKYKNCNIHFVDEDFFDNSKIDSILPLLERYNIKWLAMTTYKNAVDIFKQYTPKRLHECGCRVIEMGLENIALYKKVGDYELANPYIEICYLNLSFLDGETKETLGLNGDWMRPRSLRKPTHFNNGVWFAPGQYYYPYEKIEDGFYTSGQVARTKPTYIPESLLNEDFEVANEEEVNYYSKLVNGFKVYPKKRNYNIKEFITNDESTDWKKAMWLAVGFRTRSLV